MTPEQIAAPASTDAMEAYDAGLLNDYGGGNVAWWQDYLRAELARALGNAPYPPQLHVMGEAHKRDMAQAIAPIIGRWISEAREEGRTQATLIYCETARAKHVVKGSTHD